MALIIVFLLGVTNFAVHKAVLESGHPWLAHMPQLVGRAGFRPSLLIEFAVLLAVMAMIDSSQPSAVSGLAMFYALYTGGNLVSAWLILRGT